ncbi:MAG: EAL domain-containing protein [Pseudomonadota bacterium]
MAIFLSAVILLIPAYQMFRSNIISDFEADNLVIMKTLLQLNKPKQNLQSFEKAAQAVVKNSNINGAIIYNNQGELLARFGNIKPLTPVQLEALLTKPESQLFQKNMLVFWNKETLDQPYDIIATLDRTKIDASLTAFLRNYLDEMLIIALVIVAITLLLLNQLLLKPIARARRQLQKTIEQPGKPNQFLIKHIPRNELGEIFKINNHLLNRISDYIRQLKQKRKTLADLNSNLELKVAERTQKLSTANEKLQQEIYERKKIADELKIMASFPSENANPVLRVSSQGVLLFANATSQPVLELWHCRVGEILPKDWVRTVKSILHNKAAKNIEIKHQENYYLLNLIPVIDQNYVNIYAINITDRKKYEDKIRYLSGHDPVTDLVNLRLFEELLLQSAKSLSSNHLIAVISIEINEYRSISQSLGYHLGEKLLKQFATRLKTILPTQFLQAHAGSNHFLVGILDLTEAHLAGDYAAKIINQMSQPFDLVEQKIHIAINTGIAFYPLDASNIHDLVKKADLAMFHGKSKGQNQFQYFKETMNKELEIRHRLYQDLHLAIAKEQFYFDYQPQLELKTQKIVGVEALIRWQHPELGQVRPEEFIAILEQSHLMDNMVFWALNTAVYQHLTWKKLNLAPIRIGINLTGSQLHHPKLLAMLSELLATEKIDPRYIEIEITERTAIEDPKATSELLAQINQLGFSIAIDDFGTDYSALKYLQELPINKIKIDKSFLADWETKKEKQVIIDAIIKLAHNLGIKVICEGVENKSQIEYLAKRGCDEVQGYYISQPLASVKLVNFIKHSHKTYI